MSESLKVIDYNGEGKWSQDNIRQRYEQYCKQLKIVQPFDISPHVHVASDQKWIYPIIDRIIMGIERNDEACKIIGVELVEESRTMPFGRILKSNTARALRRNTLSEYLQERLVARIVLMLVKGNVPREYQEYAKLLRKIGINTSYWQEIDKHFPNDNQYAMRYYSYFKLYANASWINK